MSGEITMFQPSPNLKAGCNIERDAVDGHVILVSTLTQPQGRVQHHYRRTANRDYQCFNPHPTSRPGAT